MKKWPVLKSYDQNHLTRIGLPLGGIGTGTVSLGGRGQLFDWEIQNAPNKNNASADNFHLNAYGGPSFFTLYTKQAGQEPIMRVLEGCLQPPYEASHGSIEAYHGLPRFREFTFKTAYPLGQVFLKDRDVPVSVRLDAFNPLIPTDADRSGIPVAILRYVLTNRTSKPVAATIAGTLQNICSGEKRTNKVFKSGSIQGISFTGEGGNSLDKAYGSMSLAVLNAKVKGQVSTRPQWEKGSWRTPLLHFWDDLLEDGKLEKAKGEPDQSCLNGSIASSVKIPAKGEVAVTFMITWHFSNRYNWQPRKESECCGSGSECLNPSDRIGNYYSEQYKDAVDVAVKTAKELKVLERDTVRFVDSFCNSDLPVVVKESALFNASTLRSETCFRTPDGLLFGWEGCSDGGGCCTGSCTHVWNYENTTPFLFGELARGMRKVEFAHATDPKTGRMSFRVALPLDREQGAGIAAADGQMGCIIKIYRDWQLSGDIEFLSELWPKVRKALEFCWIPGGWDADRDGVMEGCQHNTMDVEYYGPNSQMGTWYLGALRAAEEMAVAMGEENFASECRELFEKGSSYLDEHLFNGEYYEHHIQPAKSWDDVAEGLTAKMGAEDPSKPRLQLGAGCLVDQLVGQYMAHVCGLGYLTKKANVRRTLRSIMKYNYKKNLYGHFNNMRTYAINDEAAILMASYPRGNRPHEPFPYYNEVMTGFEYTAATHMLYEGQEKNGLTCIESIRNRYDGLRRSPFNEAECGHHYARAMAAWTGVLAMTGFNYSGVTETFSITAGEGNHFWSTGNAWGTCTIGKKSATLNVCGGVIKVKHFDFGSFGSQSLERSKTLKAGASLHLRIVE